MAVPATIVQYQSLQYAYEFFNGELFYGRLDDCLLVLSRNPRSHGYFHAEKWSGGGLVIHELGLNAETFTLRDPEAALSTLVHEMTHHWQQAEGKKVPRKNYHNKEWAGKMEELGLIPSSTGEPGGKRTGQSMAHYIDEDGLFLPLARQFIDSGWGMPFIDVPQEKPEKKRTKFRYRCGKCYAYADGKDNLKLACLNCEEAMSVEEDEETEPAGTAA